MAKTFRSSFAAAALLAAAAGMVYSIAANAQSSGDAQMAALVQSTISTSIEVGQYKGYTYYAKVAAPGIAQIFRVPTGNPTSYAMVGTVINGRPMISPSEAEGFNSLDKNRLNAAIGSNAVLAAAPQQPSPAHDSGAGTTSPNAGGAFSAKASKGEDGNTPTVRFDSDSKFGNDIVAWRKGHIEIHRGGDKIADLGYTGGGYREGTAKRGLKIALNEIGAAVTNGRTDDVLSTGWEVTTIKGTYNTAVLEARRAPGGITQKSPDGIEAEAIAATEIFKQQIDPSFTYPGYDKLQKFAGVGPDANASTTPH